MFLCLCTWPSIWFRTLRCYIHCNGSCWPVIQQPTLESLNSNPIVYVHVVKMTKWTRHTVSRCHIRKYTTVTRCNCCIENKPCTDLCGCKSCRNPLERKRLVTILNYLPGNNLRYITRDNQDMNGRKNWIQKSGNKSDKSKCGKGLNYYNSQKVMCRIITTILEAFRICAKICRVCLKQWDLDYESMLRLLDVPPLATHHKYLKVTTMYIIIVSSNAYFPFGIFVLHNCDQNQASTTNWNFSVQCVVAKQKLMIRSTSVKIWSL